MYIYIDIDICIYIYYIVHYIVYYTTKEISLHSGVVSSHSGLGTAQFPLSHNLAQCWGPPLNGGKEEATELQQVSLCSSCSHMISNFKDPFCFLIFGP